MKPFKILAVYKPKKRRASIIGPALIKIIHDAGLESISVGNWKQNKRAIWYYPKFHAEVRRTAVKGSEGTDWHQDGDTSGVNMDCGIVMWCMSNPTQILYQGKIYQPKPFEVVYFRNLAVKHRRPPELNGIRWSFRMRVK